jgi:hypothetical protein
VRLHTHQGRTIRLPGDLGDLDGFLTSLRRASPALHGGSWRLLDAGPAGGDLLAYERWLGDDRRAVLVNFGQGPVQALIDGSGVVEVDSEGRSEGTAFDGRLGGDHAVVLRPA